MQLTELRRKFRAIFCALPRPPPHTSYDSIVCAKNPIIIENVQDRRPPAAMTDCITLLPVPKITTAQMRNGMIMRLMKDLFEQSPPELELVGSGHFGVVYCATKCSPDFFSHLLSLMCGTIIGICHVDQPVVLKFSIITNTQQYENSVRENTIHRYLSICKAPVKGHRLSVSRMVPRFYFSGYLHGFYVTVMQQMYGYVSLQQHLTTRRLTADDYVLIEWMLYQMWCLSVIHADVHLRNILWEPRLHQVVLIDFGNAMFLPPSITSQLHACFDPCNDAVVTWFKFLSTYARAVIGSRYLTGFQPDGWMLRHIRDAVADPQNIECARKTLPLTS